MNNKGILTIIRIHLLNIAIKEMQKNGDVTKDV